MGTTLTAAALVADADGHDVLALANVGDSRAYVFSEGQMSQVTADHSLAEERVRHGEISEQEAAVHPQRHILTRALGVSPEVETDMWELQLRTGDRLLLCSDGLSNEIEHGRDGRGPGAENPIRARRRGSWSTRPTATAARTTSPWWSSTCSWARTPPVRPLS